MATVGSAPEPPDLGGQITKVLLILFGVGTLFYALVTIAEFFVAGHLGDILEERRTLKKIDDLKDHHLICGFGRVGRQVARDLQIGGVDFVVIDELDENKGLADHMGAPFLQGRPSDDEMLRAAGLERAISVLACVDSDAENIFTCLTARELRSDITIVARASVEDSEKKLLRAGADRVISPYKSSGAEMARLALQPQVTGVVDVAPEYRMEEIDVSEGCAGEGKTIGEVRGTDNGRGGPPGRWPSLTPAASRHRPASGRRHGRDGDARGPEDARVDVRAHAPGHEDVSSAGLVRRGKLKLHLLRRARLDADLATEERLAVEPVQQ